MSQRKKCQKTILGYQISIRAVLECWVRIGIRGKRQKRVLVKKTKVYVALRVMVYDQLGIVVLPADAVFFLLNIPFLLLSCSPTGLVSQSSSIISCSHTALSADTTIMVEEDKEEAEQGKVRKAEEIWVTLEAIITV